MSYQEQKYEDVYPLSGELKSKFDQYLDALCKGGILSVICRGRVDSFYSFDQNGVLKEYMKDGYGEDREIVSDLEALKNLLRDFVFTDKIYPKTFTINFKQSKYIRNIYGVSYMDYVRNIVEPHIHRKFVNEMENGLWAPTMISSEPPSEREKANTIFLSVLMFIDNGLKPFKDVSEQDINKIDSENDVPSNALNLTVEQTYPYNLKAVQEYLTNGLSHEPDIAYITGLTPEKEGTINIGEDLFATTQIGKVRNNQEDAVLLYQDSKIPLKMAIVADGMGGLNNGEHASNQVVQDIRDWMKNLSLPEKEQLVNLTSTDQVKDKITQILEDISSNIRQGSGTTLLLAIRGEKNTLIVNVGDSRALAVKVSEGPCSIKEVSYEDSEASNYWRSGRIPIADLRRFYSRNHIINAFIGQKYALNPHFCIIPNNDYDVLLLTSDGVTDCLDENDLLVICKGTDRKKLSEKIVESAVNKDSTISDLWKKLLEKGDFYNLADCQ